MYGHLSNRQQYNLMKIRSGDIGTVGWKSDHNYFGIDEIIISLNMCTMHARICVALSFRSEYPETNNQ